MSFFVFGDILSFVNLSKGKQKVDALKENIRDGIEYIKVFVKWILISLIVGATGGVVGSVFHISIDYVTELRGIYTWLLFLLPLGGIVIAAIYRICRRYGHIDTNRVLNAVKRDEKVPLVMAPLIFISTIITHLLGGSAGREGAALQLGGSIGYNLGRVFRLDKKDMHEIVMSGMSAVFAALFGTPLTAAFFAIEVVTVGTLHYAAIVPCLLSAICAFKIAGAFGLHPVRFEGVFVEAFTAQAFAKVIVLACLCAIVSILFCSAIHRCEKGMKKLLPNIYLRALVGGTVIVAATWLLGTYDYNGAGMDVITLAVFGEAKPEAFIIKLVFTAITISSGFKGGEIIPAFFVGSTFGCVAGALLGLDAGFSAAIGFVAVFCGVVNCPVASTILALEVFGGEGILFFALACGVSYMMSGKSGLYKSQKILYSKLYDEI